MGSASPLDDVLANVERTLHVKRRDLLGLIGPLESALHAYQTAVETEIAREYCSAHSLPGPRGAVLSSVAAARELLRLVENLPELVASSHGQQTEPPPGPEQGAAPSDSEPAVPFPVASVLPHLVEAVTRGRLVVVGAFAGRLRVLPEPLGAATDFVDTVRDGVHALGNLPQRIRQGRIAGVIICDLAIAHQHAEPLVNAARLARIPVGFAGKGGNRGLSRALEAIEAQLRTARKV